MRFLPNPVYYSQNSGGSSGGGSGGGDDDDDDDEPRFKLTKYAVKMPFFRGEWGIGEYSPEAEAISELNGSLMNMISININPDGTQETTYGRSGKLIGSYEGSDVKMRITFINDGTLTGAISCQGVGCYPMTDGVHWRGAQDNTLIIAQFFWNGEQYWLAGHSDK